MDDKKMIPAQEPEEIYIMETEDGLLVDVPESKLDDWIEAQSQPRKPLSKAQQQLRDRIVQMIYGSEK